MMGSGSTKSLTTSSSTKGSSPSGLARSWLAYAGAVSGDWGSTHYRRRVAVELGITVEALDRGLKNLETQERGAKEYLSRSHSERLRAFAHILEVPLVRLASVDGVSSLLPDFQLTKKKRSTRPPAKRKPGSARSKGTSSAKRKRPGQSTVPLKKFPWEVEAAPRSEAAKPAARPSPPRPSPASMCESCFLPVNPHNGSCGCS